MDLNMCNHCGGEYEYRNGKWICRSCGSYKPESISNEESTLLYTAYQKLRLMEFADAEMEFDDILRKYPENPNAYWGRLMARYGIKYERDFDGRMIPTCYAVSAERLTSARDYQMALKYADKENNAFYQTQANYIERVRREWEEKASKEKPYDIFICYKDSDLAHGIDRTADSYAAQELYLHLVRKGYRVFYSRESLLDKVGEKYEPYIFHALSTAKVMIVYGTKPEYINSTWLKNEWLRYAKRMKAGEKKEGSLLVACDGFSPNALPTVLASVQCLNAGKKSFYSDLEDAIVEILKDKKRVSPGDAADGRNVRAKFGLVSVLTAMLLLTATVGSLWFFKEGKDFFEEPKDENACAHEIRVEPAVDPTCTEDGYTEGRSCIVCGEVLLARVKLLALGHTPDVKLDCEKEQKCKMCGVVLSTAGNHRFIQNVCSVCGEKETVSEGLRYTVNADQSTCTLTGIGGCRDTELIIPCVIDGYTVTAIGEEAFSGISALLSVKIAETVTSLGYGAFAYCNNLKSVEFPDGVISSSGYVFMGCENLVDVKLGNGISQIPEGMFMECEKLNVAVIPESVKHIANGAFGYTNLTELRYGGTIAQWTETVVCGEYWADGAERYTVYCADGIVTRNGDIRRFSDGLLFDSDGHGASAVVDKGNCTDTDLVLPSRYNGGDVTKISEFAFEGENLTSVVFSIGMEEIGEAAFRGCENLIRAVMAKGMSRIGYGAFFCCINLTEVTIPESVSVIDGEAFRGCESLQVIYYGGTMEQWSKIDFGERWNDETGEITVRCLDGVVTVNAPEDGITVTPGELPPPATPGEWEI